MTIKKIVAWCIFGFVVLLVPVLFIILLIHNPTLGLVVAGIILGIVGIILGCLAVGWAASVLFDYY